MANGRATEIDLLRCFAALGVVFFHYICDAGASSVGAHLYPWAVPLAKYGYLGVDLFFIISGFVIMMSAQHGGARAFIASRAARLYPAFWVCCTATALVTLPAWSTYLWNMTLVGTFGIAPLVDSVYWSLFAEVRFYALVAIVLALGQLARTEGLLAAWLAIAWLNVLWPLRAVEIALVTKYAAYFVAGATMYFVWAQGLTAWRCAVIIACLVLAIYRARGFALDMGSRGFGAVDPVTAGAIISCFFAAVMLVALRWTGFIGRRSWLTLGALTYPVYLLHQQIGLSIMRKLDGLVDARVLFWGVVLLVIGAAWLVNTQIEARFAGRMRAGVARLLAPRHKAGAAAGVAR